MVSTALVDQVLQGRSVRQTLMNVSRRVVQMVAIVLTASASMNVCVVLGLAAATVQSTLMTVHGNLVKILAIVLIM